MRKGVGLACTRGEPLAARCTSLHPLRRPSLASSERPAALLHNHPSRLLLGWWLRPGPCSAPPVRDHAEYSASECLLLT
jgi:hypothetical protein